MTKLRKTEITVDFNGFFGHMCGVITRQLVREMFTEILKRCFLPTNGAKCVKCMLFNS